MCGIFGALVVEKGARLNLAVLEELAVINEERGKHAFGFASTDGVKVKSFKSPGRPSRLAGKIRELTLAGATGFVGHTRHATHGSPQNNRNNHPHRVWTLGNPETSEGVIVHNGQIVNHEKIVRRYGLRMKSHCDSEVIPLLFSSEKLMAKHGKGRLSTLKRARMTAEAMDCPSSFLFLGPTRFAAVRMGRPLWWHKFEGVVYFSSIALDFDTDFARGQINDNAVRTYNWDKRAERWKLVGRAQITRGLRGAEGARKTKQETDLNWRKSTPNRRSSVSGPSRQERTLNERIDDIMERRGYTTPSTMGVPPWREWRAIDPEEKN